MIPLTLADPLKQVLVTWGNFHNTTLFALKKDTFEIDEAMWSKKPSACHKYLLMSAIDWCRE